MAKAASSRLVLALDVGSSSVRANLFTADARRLAQYQMRFAYAPPGRPDGAVEVDAGALLSMVFGAVDGTLRRAGDLAERIVGVGLCSFVPNLVGVDAQGVPLTPVYTWADTRAEPQARLLSETLGDEWARERTGCPWHASYLPARLLWLRSEKPELYSRVATWLSVGDLVRLQLCGRVEQSLSVASWGGLLNRHSLDWDGEMLAAVGVERERLPALVDAPDEAIGLREEFGARWPHLRGIPWFPCLGDGATGNLGSGCVGPGDVALQVGTSGAMRVLIPGPAAVESVPAGLWCYRLDRGAALLGGALSEGGNLLDWAARTLSARSSRALAQEAASLLPDSHGLTVLPFLAGERSPGWRGDARAVLAGISLGTRPAEIFRACQEAVAYRFALVYDLLREAVPQAARVVAGGGALLGVRGWAQMVADVLGVEVTASSESEASSRGTAMAVLKALGLIHSYDEDHLQGKPGRQFVPDPARHATYKRALARQQELYRKVLEEGGSGS